MRPGAAYLAAMAAGLVAGCGPLGLGPREADSAPTPTAPVVPELRPLAGLAYAEALAKPGMERYGPAALGLSEAEAARFAAAMASEPTGRLVTGGGAEALVFAGCAAAGCDEAAAVLAIDAETGAAFLGVRDGAGADELAPNPRVEALLRLTSASGRWDEPRLEAPDARLPQP